MGFLCLLNRGRDGFGKGIGLVGVDDGGYGIGAAIEHARDVADVTGEMVGEGEGVERGGRRKGEGEGGETGAGRKRSEGGGYQGNARLRPRSGVTGIANFAKLQKKRT